MDIRLTSPLGGGGGRGGGGGADSVDHVGGNLLINALTSSLLGSQRGSNVPMLC